VNSIFAGQTAHGALQAFFFFGILSIGAGWLLAPTGSRHRFLARLLVMFSSIAVLSLFALRGKILSILAAGGTAPHIAFVPVLVALTLQLALALFYLWRSNQQPPASGRGGQRLPWWTWGPAALFVPLLLIAGFVGHPLLDQGADNVPSSLASSTNEEIYTRHPKATDFGSAEETPRAGKDFGGSFAHYYADHRPLLGFSFSVRDWQRDARVSNDLRGIFDIDAPRDADQAIVAKPGYVVTALQAQVDVNVHTFRVKFARDGEWGVDSMDSYWSEWTSDFQPGLRVVELGDIGTPACGISGTSGLVLNSLSLIEGGPANDIR
jgi:hypothetical protein